MKNINSILILSHYVLVLANLSNKHILRSYKTERQLTTHLKKELTSYATIIQKLVTTENPFEGRNGSSAFMWADDALKDVAYYLRAHKFNEYDRRYELQPESAPREYFKYFPRPALRSLHWEVHKYCETSFLSCIEYLNRQIRHTGLKRVDDTSIVMQEQQWNYLNHSKQIDAIESDCRKMQKADNILANPFQGPIERFQWRATASYYMCWYTMNGVSDLKRLKEDCDNFANCLDPNFGVHNKDPRADDNMAYSCALYSFCPDPCCPLKHLYNSETCWNEPENPCFVHNPDGQRQCSMNRSQNTDFRDIVLNRWNVTCKCTQVGFEWSSKYGLCIDIDECLLGLHNCNPTREACVNLPGSFRCACRWGFVWNSLSKSCEASGYLDIIKVHNVKQEIVVNNTKATSIVKRLFHLIFPRNSANHYSRLYSKLIIFQWLIYYIL